MQRHQKIDRALLIPLESNDCLFSLSCLNCHTSKTKDKGVAVTCKLLTPEQIADFYHQGKSAQEHIKTINLNNQISLLSR